MIRKKADDGFSEKFEGQMRQGRSWEKRRDLYELAILAQR